MKIGRSGVKFGWNRGLTDGGIQVSGGGGAGVRRTREERGRCCISEVNGIGSKPKGSIHTMLLIHCTIDISISIANTNIMTITSHQILCYFDLSSTGV